MKRFTPGELRKQSRYWANVAATTGAYTYECTAAMLRQAADDAEAVERLTRERDEARAIAAMWHPGDPATWVPDWYEHKAIIASWGKENQILHGIPEIIVPGGPWAGETVPDAGIPRT